MNREIKFRAWIASARRWASSVSVYSDGSWCASLEQEDGSTVDGYCDADGSVLVQFTGLRDKNGKEIYEGDIVRTSDGIGSVEIDHGSTWGRFEIMRSNLDVDLCNGRSVEIIGNIFENPKQLSALRGEGKK